jgi:DNA-binding transcriptional ArsR family regulator
MKDALKLQKLLQTLGDSNRLRIIHFIGEKICSVNEIVEAVELSQPLVSHHLRAMKETGILETTRKGPFIYYKLTNKNLIDVLGILNVIAKDVKIEGSHNSPMFPCPSWWKNKKD